MIKSFFKHIIFDTGLPVPIPHLIPVYHCVSDERLPHIQNVINYKNLTQFEKDIDYMCQKFEFCDWESFTNNNSTGKKPFALLTFDDGLVEFKDVVLPVLERKGIYAVNFINPAFVDNQDMMFRFKASLIVESLKTANNAKLKSVAQFLSLHEPAKNKIINSVKSISYHQKQDLEKIAKLLDFSFSDYIKKQKIYLNLADLQEIQKKGFGISAHSWDHPYFFHLSLEEQLESAQKSIDFCTENHFLDESFAFPFTDFSVSDAFFKKLFKNNPQLQFTFGTAGIKIDSFPQNLQRIPMERGYNAQKEIDFEKTYFQIKKIFNKNKIYRK